MATIVLWMIGSVLLGGALAGGAHSPDNGGDRGDG